MFFMKKELTEIWFEWFYANWEKFAPGDQLDNGLLPSKVAERFVSDNQDQLINLAKNIDPKDSDALDQFMQLTESELHVIKYFLKLVRLKRVK